MTAIPNTNCSPAEILSKFSEHKTMPWLLVDTATQTLCVLENENVIRRYSISTSKYGNGCQQDSLQTPTGAHVIAQCIGAGEPLGEIFVARQKTGKCAEILTDAIASDQDLILTRIMWLQGLEQDKNMGEGCDSYSRYIYIHGTHEEGLLGSPASHGCIRMSNKDVIELYDCVSEGTFIYIE